MSSILLAIKSCHKDANLEQIQRGSFLHDAAIDHRFFRGRAAAFEAPDDVVALDVDDDFLDLPFKVQAMCRWIVAAGYHRAFFIDTDTYCRPERVPEIQDGPDYVGFYAYDPCPGAYAVGGSGYMLNARAMRIVADSTFIRDYPDQQRYEPSKRGEDLQVAWALMAHGIKCVRDNRLRIMSPGPLVGNDLITLHDIRQIDKARRIPEAHAFWRTSGGR